MGETIQEARARLKATRKLEDVALRNLEAQRKDEERQAKRQRAGAKAKGKPAAEGRARRGLNYQAQIQVIIPEGQPRKKEQPRKQARKQPRESSSRLHRHN